MRKYFNTKEVIEEDDKVPFSTEYNLNFRLEQNKKEITKAVNANYNVFLAS